jgi:hypothetical protein
MRGIIQSMATHSLSHSPRKILPETVRLHALGAALSHKPLVYVTRDIERALGLTPHNGYYIVTNPSHYAKKIKKEYPDNVWLAYSTDNTPYDTHELLMHKEVIKEIKRIGGRVVVFKNTREIERLCKEHGLELINPSAVLAQNAEEKISQIEWLGPLADYLPPFSVAPLKHIVWDGIPFIIQFNHGHTGSGTHLIEMKDDLEMLALRYPERPAKKCTYVKGPIYTINVSVPDREVNSNDDGIVLGNISLQITGLRPFTDYRFSTVGNDFAIPHSHLDPMQENLINIMARKVASRLQKSGWRGLFGIDVVVEKESGHAYLLEINARQPAGAVFESYLQKIKEPDKPSIFEAHLAHLLNIPFDGNVTELSEGAQIVQRVTKETPAIATTDELAEKGFKVITYTNSKDNADLVRIQSTIGIMRDEYTLNAVGQKIFSK